MDSKYIIDSSIFVAFYYEGDQNHTKALEIIKNILGKTLIVHPYVISEVATVLTYKVSKKVAEVFLSDVIGVDDVFIPNPDVLLESEFFLFQKKKISFTDSTLVYLAKKLNAKLVTFDKQMIASLK